MRMKRDLKSVKLKESQRCLEGEEARKPQDGKWGDCQHQHQGQTRGEKEAVIHAKGRLPTLSKPGLRREQASYDEENEKEQSSRSG